VPARLDAKAMSRPNGIVLLGDLVAQMIVHAKQVYPEEACGLLTGRDGRATRFVPLKNVLRSETAYEIDPAIFAATLRSIRDAAEELIAIFHSHPRGQANPSKSDLERAAYADVAHVIVSLAIWERPEIRAFRIIDGHDYEIELHAIV